MTSRAKILGLALEYRRIEAARSRAPTLVFLHEGLGCVEQWRDFPDRLAAPTGCGAFMYSRRGYGRSDPIGGPRELRFMHDEALEVLPALRAHFGLEDIVLFGHSDGASIALIHAAARPGGVRGLVLEAPHVFVEDVCVESIAKLHAGFEASGLAERLARYHGAQATQMFREWAGVWLRPAFRHWNIEDCLPAIRAPMLVIQGRNDEYGTVAQVHAIASQVRGPAQSLLLEDCGHAPHRDQADAVLHASAGFIDGLV